MWSNSLVWAVCLCVVNYGSSCGDKGGVLVLGVLVVCGLVTHLRDLTPFIHAPTDTMISQTVFSSSSSWAIFPMLSGDHCLVSSLPLSAGCRCADQWSQRHLLCAGSVRGNKSLSRPSHWQGSVRCQTPSEAHMLPVRTLYYRYIQQQLVTIQSIGFHTVCKTTKWVIRVTLSSAESLLPWLRWRVPRCYRVSGEDELMMTWWHNHRWLGAWRVSHHREWPTGKWLLNNTICLRVNQPQN